MELYKAYIFIQSSHNPSPRQNSPQSDGREHVHLNSPRWEDNHQISRANGTLSEEHAKHRRCTPDLEGVHGAIRTSCTLAHAAVFPGSNCPGKAA